MTSAMSVSRIPVPVRNFDRHRTISAKTRLERLRDEFQRKLYFEKQAKLHDFYTEKQRRKSKAADGRQIKSGEIGYGHYRNADDFFGERESLLSGQRNGYASPKNNFPNVSGRSRRRPPLPPYTKRSAGRDRAHLLAPINPARPNQGSPKTREFHETGNATLSPSPDYLADTYTLRKLDLETAEQKLAPKPPPIASRPKIMRPYVRNRTHQVQFHDETDGGGEGQFDQPNLERLKQEKLRQLNDDVSDGSNQSLRKLGGRGVTTSPGSEGLPRKTHGASDFQKWQSDQNEERARRLQRLNEKSRNQAGSSFHEELGKGDGKREPQTRQHELRMENDDGDNDDEDNGDEDNGDGDNNDEDNGNEDNEKEDEVWRQKQQVLQVHNRKEAAVEMKVSDEDEEDFEDKRLKQKERELQELIRRQENELQKLRVEKFEDDGEEKRKETQKRQQRQTKVLQQKPQILEAEKLQQKAGRDLGSPSVVDKPLETASSEKTSRNRPSRRASVASLPPKQTWEPKIDPNNEETAFYLQKAISEGNRGADDVRLVPCQICGRSFANNRLAKHEKICTKESKKTRKVFDEVAMRYKGTDFERHVKRRRNSVEEEPIDEKKSHWRTKHQNFIETIKYAKKVAKVQSEGGSLSNLPPPPVTVNPDYVQCPHCQRRFNKNAADRHIPWCKDSKSRQPPKSKGRRQ